MRILAVDMGTGTQDILLFESGGPVENCVKLVMPSATRIAEGRIRAATAARRTVVLTGTVQGGGPCSWALKDHLRAGLPAFATPSAALTIDDDLEAVERLGVRLLSEDEAARVDGDRVTLRDLDLGAIRAALAAFDVPGDFDGIAIACLDHGAAPPGTSDRLFRFEHLRRVVAGRNDLRAFAMRPADIPPYLTRALAMVAAAEAGADGAPVAFLDTGPAAALGALQDRRVAEAGTQLVLNLGNMHALAFHLRGYEIVALYEHHTGEITTPQIEDFSRRLVAGSLRHEEIFDSKGHGAFYAQPAAEPGAQPGAKPGAGAVEIVAVTGPQRGKLAGSSLAPWFATPHGDMMISGCFGLLVAFAELHPEHREEIEAALDGGR